jgi:hypothetical protein
MLKQRPVKTKMDKKNHQQKPELDIYTNLKNKSLQFNDISVHPTFSSTGRGHFCCFRTPKSTTSRKTSGWVSPPRY